MKIFEPIRLNVTQIKSLYGEEISMNDVKSELVANGASVRGYRNDDNAIIMEVSGDIELEDFEQVFNKFGIEPVYEENNESDILDDEVEEDDDELSDEEMLFDDEDVIECGESLSECDTIEECGVKESVKTPRFSKELIESFTNGTKKTVKPVKKSNKMINLSEALGFTKKNENYRDLSLNDVIDNMIGVGVNESIMNKAINKVKAANTMTLQECYNKLGKNSFGKIVESLENRSNCLYGDIKVNGKKIAEYTVNELRGLLEKLEGQISELNRKIGLNEGDTKKLNEVLANKMKLQTILENEITYRVNYRMFEDDEKKDDKFDGETERLADDIVSQVEDAEEPVEEPEEEQNPDEDTEEEVSSVIITLVNMDAAEKMKAELIEAGIPEEFIVLEEVSEEEPEESEEEESVESEEKEESETEEAEEPAEEEKQEESVRVNGSKLNEADEEETESEENEEEVSEEEPVEEPAEETEESEEEETEDVAVKLILKNTDYITVLMDVLENLWGMTKEEFEELIGGEIVPVEEESDDEEESEEEETEEDDDMDFNPDDIFKNL